MPLGPLPLYPSAAEVVNDVKAHVSEALKANSQRPPRVVVVGALGRCGTGAIDLCLAAGVPREAILK